MLIIVNESGREVNKLSIDDDLNVYQTLSNTLKSFEVEIPIAIEAKDNLLIIFLISEGYEVYLIRNPLPGARIDTMWQRIRQMKLILLHWLIC